MAAYNPDPILGKLMTIGKADTGLSKIVSEQEIVDLCVASYNLFMSQPVCLEISAPVTIAGDVHGQYGDLMRMFNLVGFPPKVSWLFLGDYIDRGKQSLETICLLFAIKIKYPDNFFLLRGNHETALVNRIYGFYEEIVKRYGTARLFNVFQDVFNVMPLTAVVSERILCMHGGLSQDLMQASSLAVLRDITRPLPDPPNPSLPLDLLWADPDIAVTGFKYSIRGVSCTFGTNVIDQVLKKHNLDLIVRAHQVVQDGYEFFHNRKLVTIFSAPHYCGQFDNAAAVMQVNKELRCSFKILRPKFPNAQKKTAGATDPKDITCYKPVT
ncbi:unnamed protein product, partial [Mesorhabditis spiculigera]